MADEQDHPILHVCYSKDLHPYECGGDRGCFFCRRARRDRELDDVTLDKRAADEFWRQAMFLDEFPTKGWHYWMDRARRAEDQLHELQRQLKRAVADSEIQGESWPHPS